MNKESAINTIINLIMKAFDENNYSYIVDAFSVAFDFNDEHLGESEIFMAEDEEYVIVDDDVFYFEGRF